MKVGALEGPDAQVILGEHVGIASARRAVLLYTLAIEDSCVALAAPSRNPMAIAPDTLLSIRQAGESLYAARQAFAQEVQHNARRMVGVVASEPFSSDADRAYAQLRSVARLAHELQALEEQLKALYVSAADLASAEPPALVTLPDQRARSRTTGHVSGVEVTEDAAVKSRPGPGRNAKKAGAKHAAPAMPAPRRMSGNDEKVLAYLTQVLDRRSWKPYTQAVIGQEAGVALGSVGMSLRRLLAAGKIREREKGRFKLA